MQKAAMRNDVDYLACRGYMSASEMYSAAQRAGATVAMLKSLSDRQLRYETILRWNGVLPVYSGSGPVPFLQLNK